MKSMRLLISHMPTPSGMQGFSKTLLDMILLLLEHLEELEKLTLKKTLQREG